jgi:hypothetical protein
MKPNRQRQPKPAAPPDISMPDFLDHKATTNHPTSMGMNSLSAPAQMAG